MSALGTRRGPAVATLSRGEQLTLESMLTEAQLDTTIAPTGEQLRADLPTDEHRARDAALTDEQERAVERRSEPLLLAAGAGSGKTSVLVERFVRAVREDGVAPARILAITFTERAASELRERVRHRFVELGDREAARDTQAAFLGTFHGFCARVLSAHALAAGLEPGFAILDESAAAGVRERAFTLALRAFIAGEPAQSVDLLAAYGPDRVRAMIDSVYAELRSRGQAHPRLPLQARPQRPAAGEGLAQADGLAAAPFSADADGHVTAALLDELLDAFGSSYAQLKRARGAVDFDDLELAAGELLRSSESVRVAWSERFELLMVDEFQDTNPRQLAILQALERDNLFTVGDERQAIYGFRHADVSLFRARRAALVERGCSLELVRNFRSRPELLEVVNTVFARRFGDEYRPLEPGREDGASDDEEPLVELLLTSRRGWDGADGERASSERGAAPRWRQAEARMLAGRVEELVLSGEARAGEIVVLLRAVGDLEVYERALRARGLRTLAAAGGFWSSQQVGDLLCYLRALANPLDELAIFGTLASPLVGVSSDGLALLARAARARGAGQLWATARSGAPQLFTRLPARDRAALDAFGERFEHERRTAAMRTLSQLIERAVDASGYRAHLLALDGAERRAANVEKLLRFARRFEASEGRDLRGFLDEATRLTQASGAVEPDAAVAAVEPQAIRLMSIHAAKGLEFPVVCIADLGRAANLSVPDLLLDGDRVGVRLAHLDGSEPTPALDFAELSHERSRAQADEEERIFYVAMTRARERLILSGAVDFERWPAERLRAPAISWLAPALAPELPAILLAATRSGHAAPEELIVGTGAGAARVRCRLNAPRPASGDGPVSAYGARSSIHEPGAVRRMGSSSTQRAPSSIPDSGFVDTMELKVRDERRLDTRPGPASAPATAVSGREATPRGLDPAEHLGTLSYTALGELERCGYRYYLERVLGLPEDRSATARSIARAEPGSARDGLDARARGTLVHRLLESVDFSRPRAPSAEQIAGLARELGVHLARSEREQVAALVGVVTGGALQPLGRRLSAAESVRREHPFALSLRPHEPVLTGVIDVLARELDGGVLIVDYKTDRVGGEVDLATLTECDYGAQRLLYALAALRDGAPKVEIVHWFLERPDEWIGAQFAPADRRELEERLAARIDRVRARGFSVSSDPHKALCETCPGRTRLCSWSDADTGRQLPAAGERLRAV